MPFAADAPPLAHQQGTAERVGRKKRHSLISGRMRARLAASANSASWIGCGRAGASWRRLGMMSCELYHDR